MNFALPHLLVPLFLAALVAAGCGGDVCGSTSTGTVVIVESCRFTAPTPTPVGRGDTPQR